MQQQSGVDADGAARDRFDVELPPAIANEVWLWVLVLESVALESIEAGPLAPELDDIETPLEEFEAKVRARVDFETAVEDVRTAITKFSADLADPRIAEALTLRAMGIYALIDPLGFLPLIQDPSVSLFALRDPRDAARMGAILQPGQIWARVDGLPRGQMGRVFDRRDWAAEQLGLPAPKTGRRQGRTDHRLDDFARSLDPESPHAEIWARADQIGVTPEPGRYRQRADPAGNERRRKWVGRIRARALDMQRREARSDEAMRRAKTTVKGKHLWDEVDSTSGERVARRPKKWR